MHSRDPSLAAQFAEIKEAEQIRRFIETQAYQNRGMGRPVRAKFSRTKAVCLLILGGCAAVAILAWGAVLDRAYGAERELTCYRVEALDNHRIRCGHRVIEVEGLRNRYIRAKTLEELTSEAKVRCTVNGSDSYGSASGRCGTTVGGDFSARIRQGGYISPYRKRDR